MSLATSIKDFADLLTEISAANGFNGDFPKALLLQHALIYSGKAFISLLVYIFSLQWLRDISYLPLLVPPLDGASLFGDSLFNNPASHLFSFSSIPKQATDQLFAGFVNSFFLSLPFSLPHLVSLRRLFFQGPAAAGASVIGIVASNTLFLIATVYGLRFLIIPYFSLEPLNYILGILIVAILVKGFAEQKGFKLVPLWDKNTLVKMSSQTFLLTWCEESNLFHSFNNLTLNTQNSCFDLYPCATLLESFIVHTTYILAFFVGHCFFSAIFYYFILMASQYLSSLAGFTTAMITVRLSKFMLFLIVALTVSSFPYYGLDYLIANRAGFLPEDPIFNNTVLSPTRVQTKYPHFFKEMPPAQRDQKTALNLDLNYFDRGLYLNAPKQKKGKVSALPLPALSFEELNYQGEYAWIVRNQLSKDLSKMRPSVFTPMFKKPRRRYLQLRKLHDNKMEEAARVASNRTLPGATTTSLEGILPEEGAPLFIKMGDFLGRAFLSPLSLERDFLGKPLPNGRDFQGKPLTNDREFQNSLPKVKSSVKPLSETSISDSFSNGRKDGEKKSESHYQERFHDKSVSQMPTAINAYAEQQFSDDSDIESNSPHISAQDKAKEKYNRGAKQNSQSKEFTTRPIIQISKKDKKKDPIKEELVFERKLQKKYSKGFVPPFSLAYERTRFRYLPVKNVIKKRFFLNNVYKSLLQTDIDSFLSRQPANYKLAENQELQLYKKRQMLQQYYNWLRCYKPFEKMMQLRFRIPDTKSFVDRVYHQQFKGTLKIARRLFKVTFDAQQNPIKNRVLSYDQMLYKDLPSKQNPFLHEELLYPNAPEGVANPNCFSTQPFIEESNSSPTYAGWDPLLRRFVVTNRFVLKASN